MRFCLPFFVGLALFCGTLKAQTEVRMQEVCSAAQMPGLAWVHCNADTVLSEGAVGVSKRGRAAKLHVTQAMRVGSLTKWFSTLIIEKAIQAGVIRRNPRFFDCFPTWKSNSLKAYHNLRLSDLVAMRSGLPSYTYTHAEPAAGSFTGNAHERRLQFLQWCFQQHPVSKPRRSYRFCNPAFVAAIAMLEVRSHTPFRQAMAQLLEPLHMVPQWGQPNASDTNAVWGHTGIGIPESPAQPEALEWLDPAGNLCLSPHDLGRCVQHWLKAARGTPSPLVSAAHVQQVLRYRSGFHGGWFITQSASGTPYLQHLGNPGSFLCLVQIAPAKGEAVVLMCNIQNQAATEALQHLALEMLE